MLKYRNNWFDECPTNQLIVWIGPPNSQEVYGFKRSAVRYEEVSGKVGFLPKYWRESTDAEKQSFPDPSNVVNLPKLEKKRGRPKK